MPDALRKEDLHVIRGGKSARNIQERSFKVEVETSCPMHLQTWDVSPGDWIGKEGLKHNLRINRNEILWRRYCLIRRQQKMLLDLGTNIRAQIVRTTEPARAIERVAAKPTVNSKTATSRQEYTLKQAISLTAASLIAGSLASMAFVSYFIDIAASPLFFLAALLPALGIVTANLINISAQ